MKIKACFVIVLVLCLFNLDCVYAKMKASSVFYQIGAKENPNFVFDELIFVSEFTTEETAFILFTNLFENKPPYAESFVPEGTRLLFARFSDGNLAVNVSEEIKNYGGSYYERHLIRQLAETAFSITCVQSFSLYIDGGLGELPEGSEIKNYTRTQHQELISSF